MTVDKSPLLASVLVGIAALAGAGPVRAAIPPPHPLYAEAEKILAEKLDPFGPGYKGRYDPARKVIYVTALDEEHFASTLRLVVSFSDAFTKTLGAARPQEYITIVLPTVQDYRRLVPDEGTSGRYFPAERTLISIDRQRVLLHELTHALHHADCSSSGQLHAIWVWEGLACLSESSTITPSGLQPHVDRRLLTLQQAIRLKDTIPLAELLKMKPKAFEKVAALSYAEARYLMLYLHQKGKLRDWYASYKKSFTKDPSGRFALEKVLRRKAYRIEDDWKAWAAGLALPWGEQRSSQGRLGLEVRDTKAGPKVVSLVSGSAAELAGQIKVGDIVMSFNGHRTRNAVELVAAIRAAGAMQTVVVEVRRKGRILAVHQPLGQPQAQFPTVPAKP